jgi:hypothetical protein
MPIAIRCPRCCWGILFGAVSAFAWAAAEEPDPGIGDPYPLENCFILDQPLDRVVMIMDRGREIRVCCKECRDRYFQEAYTVLARINEQIVQEQRPHYPLKTCVVDDKPLQEKATVELVFRNRLFRLCSEKCGDALQKQPAKCFGKLDFSVIESQKPNYPLRTCLVTGKPLGDTAFDYVIANRLVRLSSLEQVSPFNRTPAKYLQKLTEASAARAKSKG